MSDRRLRPLIYSCSGVSSAAQLANHIAVTLDRHGDAEMSCIAGLGGDVPSLVTVARAAVRSGRAIVAIDGCVLRCVQRTLERHGITPTVTHELQNYDVKKIKHGDFDLQQAAEVTEIVRRSLPRCGRSAEPPATQPVSAAPS